VKKVLYSLLLFASIFFVGYRVKAANYTLPLIDNFFNYYNQSYDLSDDFDNILSIAEDKDYNIIITVFHHSSDVSGNSCFSSTEIKCSYIEHYYVYLIKNNYVPTFKFDGSWIYSSINSNIVGLDVVVDINYTSTYNSLINALNNSDFSMFSSNFNVSTGSGKQWYYTPSSITKPMIYGASADYTISFSSNTYYFGEYQITSGGLLPTYKNYVKTYDTYTLSNLEYSAIEVKFNINDFPMIDEGNDINLEYEIKLDTDMIIPLLPIPQEKIYRNMALGDYSIGTTMNLLFDEKANNYVYEGTKHYDYWNTITYRFEFPFTNDYVGNITLNFYSDSNYTITLEERSNEENDIKYTELDLTGKYGVGFIPKVSSFDVYNEFYGIFKVPYQNNYRLMFYKDYSYVSQNNKSNLILDKVLLTFENFEYKFTKENKNSYLFFINNNYESGSEASILYNSNYFNYCILDEELSSCDIINPNTDESVTINPNLGDLDSFGVKDILHSFKTFSNSTNFILENVTNFYNNFLPDELKIFFFISFGFAVIIMITKIVL